MNSKREAEILKRLFKEYIRQNVSLRDIAKVRREVGNLSHIINVSKEEILEVVKPLLQEVFTEEMARLR